MTMPDNNTAKKRASVTPPTLPARLLVVDDDKDILDLLTFYLQHEGYKVATANSGEEALALLDEFSPDVMCIDFMMPKMDGQELARQIRARHDMLYIPIVMLTAIGSQEKVKLDSLNSGVDAFLNKPVSRSELTTTIRTLLRVKSAQDNMLAALDRVAEVQDELLDYERHQSRESVLQNVLGNFNQQLDQPLSLAESATNELENLLQARNLTKEELSCLNGLKLALSQTRATIKRLSQPEQYEQ